jgi:hypothetical protein
MGFRTSEKRTTYLDPSLGAVPVDRARPRRKTTPEQKRAIWELERIGVYDSSDTLFLT